MVLKETNLNKQSMNILIRVDASLKIGSGHVMRCLTLAKQLRYDGANVIFVCREHQGHMQTKIEENAFICLLLSNEESAKISIESEIDSETEYLSWLGCSLEKDVEQTIKIAKEYSDKYLMNNQYDWIVCDHYAIDKSWHQLARKFTKKILVIDDLANRKYDCDVLLDQTFLCENDKYENKINSDTYRLYGTDYALLGSDYSDLRTDGLLQKRQLICQPTKILVFMGGSDKVNWTIRVLNTLNTVNLSSSYLKQLSIDIVIGSQYQYKVELSSLITTSELKISLLENINNMAERIADADIAIGAGGGSSWERCCLALPTLTCVVADNQRELSAKLESFGAIIVWETEKELKRKLTDIFIESNRLSEMSLASSKVCDGRGTKRVSKIVFELS